ncbi:MAG: glycosyltransferase [Flavobacteriales bacterium]|nr:glycosyltransferase [Flavobacteriales bacterium]
MAEQTIIISVTNDLTTDQRVARICDTYVEMGFQVLLVGRKLGSSQPVKRNYRTRRFRLWFNKGPLFYANYNIRLFFFLLFTKSGLLWSNDLDTLPANYLASSWKKTKLIYDSHEYFTEVPELIDRPRVKRFWKRIERRILPRLQHIITVSPSIAEQYQSEYGITVQVVRNLPELSRKKVAVPDLHQDNRKIIIYQGAINVNRGIEFMVKAMHYVDNCVLYLAGKGDLSAQIEALIEQEKLQNNVIMLGEIPQEELHGYTIQAHLGLSLEEDRGLNYRFALPNKLFNYIHAGVPVLVSDLPEMKGLVAQYAVGDWISTHEPEQIAQKIESMLRDEQYQLWKSNCLKAKEELCWEKEKEVIRHLI